MGKPLPNVDWPKLQLVYQRGNCSLRELAETYNVSLHALEGRCRREKWVQQMQELSGRVSAKVVESLADAKVKAILAHEALVVPIAEKLIHGVEKTFDDMHGEALEPSELQGLAMSLKTANSVARLNLGAVDPTSKVDVTSGGQSMHDHSLAVMASIALLQEQGKLVTDAIDVEALLLEQSKQEQDKTKQD